MADDETNIVLTADVSGYERSIDQAANATNMMLNGVVKLTTAIDTVFKTAGKTMQIGGAGMVASITAAGYAAGRLESQMAQLSASTKMASDSQAQYELQMTKYSKTVTTMRSEFGMTRMPLLVSRCVARQFMAITRPLPSEVRIQSPSSNGCSNRRNSPDSTDPTAFCSARPMTIDPMPSAVKSPPTSAP